MKRYVRAMTPTRQRLLDAKRAAGITKPKERRRPLTEAEKLHKDRRKLAHSWLVDTVKQQRQARQIMDNVRW